MTRKDYVAIAEAIYTTRETLPIVTGYWEAQLEAIGRATQLVADVFAEDNPRFDRARFIAACEGTA